MYFAQLLLRIFVTIENRGLGPMVIEKVEVVKAGKDLMKGGQDAGHSSLVYAADFPFVEEYVDDFDGNLVGRVLQQGGETVLFRAKGESSDENFLKYLSDLRMYLAGVEFIVHYKDMYDVHQAPSRRSGLWFGRHFKSDADIELKTLTRQHA